MGRIQLSKEVRSDVAAATKQFNDTLNDEYANLDAQRRIDETVGALVALLEVEPALAHLPASCIDAIADSVARTFEYEHATENILLYVRNAFIRTVDKQKHVKMVSESV